jgi:WD40 repeat protein/tetratricopeptide (TPR) repeat protein
VWNATTGEPLTPPLRQALPARAAAFTSDGRSVVVASGAEGSDTGETRLWEVRPPGAEAVLDRWEGKRSGWSWIDKEGRRAISWHGNIARVWDARTGQPQTPPLSHPWPIGQAALSPDGRRLLVVDAGLRHSRFRLWDLETGRPFTGMLPTSDSFSFIYWAFSPDSRLLVLVGENTRVLDMTTGEAVGKVLHHDRAWEPNRAALSADGRFVATASDDWMARVWELSSGRLVLPPRRHSQPVQSINFSPAGDVLVTTTGRHAFLWNCQTGQLCSPPLHHGDGLACAAVSPDGRWVATGGGNGSNGEIRIWDAATGQPVSAALQHPRRVSFVRFREDGKVVEASTADGLVWNWSLPSDRLPVEVCSARAQLAAGQRVSPVGGLEPLDAEAFRDAWQRLLAEHGPPSLGHPAPAVLAWERAEAEAAKSAGDWHAVERHYRQVLLAGGDPRTVYPLIGSALGSAKLWSAAADALAQSVDADNADPEVWHQLAVASLLAGRADAYRRLCLRLVDRFAADADPATASQLLWTCTLAPNAGVEPERLRKLAEQARPRDADATAVLRHAAALYRLARFDDVLKELVPVTTRDAANSPRSWLFEAMAYHHLGQHEKARKAFDEAAKAQLSPSAAWYVPEELHLLKAEAETTLGSEGKTSQTVGPAPLSPP